MNNVYSIAQQTFDFGQKVTATGGGRGGGGDRGPGRDRTGDAQQE